MKIIIFKQLENKMKLIILTLALAATAMTASVDGSLCANFDQKLARVDKFTFDGKIKPGAKVTINCIGEVLMTTTITQAYIKETLNGLVVKNGLYPLSKPYNERKGDTKFSHTFEIPNIPLVGKFVGRFILEDAKEHQLACVDLTVKF